MMRWTLTLLALLLASAATLAAPSWQRDAAIRDSMMAKGPLLGHRWLKKNGLEDYLLRQSWKPTEDSGLACVGRWSYGPSLKVSLRVTADDTVICLTRGSGASLIRFRSRDSVSLDLLGDVNFAGIPRRAIIQDTLAIAGIHSGGTGLEVHGMSTPDSPNLLSRVDLPVVNDIAVKDTLVYVACEDDSLRIFSIADPRSPRRVGACRDSCDLFMTQADGYCYLVHVSGVNIVDVSDPASPRRVGRIGGGEPLAVYVRDTLACVTIYQYGLRVYDVSDPSSPSLLGSLPGQDALDITMAATCDTVVYTPVLDIINVANPGQPRLLGHTSNPAGDYGVCALPALSYALAANYSNGLVAVDINNPGAPLVDTAAFAAGLAVDISVRGNRAYLASYYTGLAVLDVTSPSIPIRLGGIDLPGASPSCYSVVADDSFAFMHWYARPQFQSVDVSDPRRPVLAGGADVLNPPEDMVLRDSFVYCAKANRFQVVNVARPREPALVGSCVTQDGVRFGLAVQDTFAYVMSGRLQIVNIARPDSPVVVSTNSVGGATGVAVCDTFVYVPYGYDTLRVFSAAVPTAPRLLGFAPLQTHCWDVALAESTAAVATFNGLELFSLENPSQPRWRGAVSTPYGPRRVVYSAPYFYTAMWEAGVAVFETVFTGLSEPGSERPQRRPGVRAYPSPVHRTLRVNPVRGLAQEIQVRDGAGRLLAVPSRVVRSDAVEFDVSELARGVYFIQGTGNWTTLSAKFVKQ